MGGPHLFDPENHILAAGFGGHFQVSQFAVRHAAFDGGVFNDLVFGFIGKTQEGGLDRVLAGRVPHHMLAGELLEHGAGIRPRWSNCREDRWSDE